MNNKEPIRVVKCKEGLGYKTASQALNISQSKMFKSLWFKMGIVWHKPKKT